MSDNCEEEIDGSDDKGENQKEYKWVVWKANQFTNPDLLADVISDVWNNTLFFHKFQEEHIEVTKISCIYSTYLLGVGWVFLPEILMQGPGMGIPYPLEHKGHHPAHLTSEEHKLREIVNLPQIERSWMMGRGLEPSCTPWSFNVSTT